MSPGLFADYRHPPHRALPLTGPALDVLRERSQLRRVDTDMIFANRRGCALFHGPRRASAVTIAVPG